MKTGVLLVNLGTPDSPRPPDVKRFLTQFLTDRRVIKFPWLFRQVLVRGVIVRKRYRNSAKLYASIWTDRGSPLKVYSVQVAAKLKEDLGEEFQVELAMRYQNPSIKEALEKLKGVERLVIVPLFPQYASATTGSVYQEVFHQLKSWEVIPSLMCIDQFATQKDVIEAFCQSAKGHDFSDFDHILFSYHGLPEAAQGTYTSQCEATTEAICNRLGLSKENISHSYQSRLGKDPWIKPYTYDTLKKLADGGKKKVLVFCPSFVSDCLETLHEIAVEYRADFKGWGGEKLELVPGLNASPAWISALKQMILQQ